MRLFHVKNRVKRMLVTTNQAKIQLEIEQDDDYYDEQIPDLIDRATGQVCGDIGRPIFETADQVPEQTEAPIILANLLPYETANLRTACLLQISSLFSNREVETDKPLNKNAAYTTAIKGFKRIIIG